LKSKSNTVKRSNSGLDSVYVSNEKRDSRRGDLSGGKILRVCFLTGYIEKIEKQVDLPSGGTQWAGVRIGGRLFCWFQWLQGDISGGSYKR